MAKKTYTFIDLFAGIGGFHQAMHSVGMKCVFASEWDKNARISYEANYKNIAPNLFENNNKYFNEDITKQDPVEIPPFDVCCGGFPCQPFSIAGLRRGFEDTRGTLFFNIANIVKQKISIGCPPKVLFLENVKGLKTHMKGETLKTILATLEELGYAYSFEVLNAKNFGVPQNRERIYIVGFHKCTGVNSFSYPEPLDKIVTFADIKEEKTVPTKYYLSTQYIDTLRKHKERHESKGNGFGYEIIPDDGIANAIVVGGMGRERNLVIDHRITDFTPTTNIKGEVNREGIRKMTPREWARLQGFPDSYVIPVSDASAYKQFGNSVAVPAIQATGKKILEKLCY